jgi:predicted metalloprotease
VAAVGDAAVVWAGLVGGRGIGVGTIVIALIGGWAFGINPLTILGLLSGGGAPTEQVQQQAPARKPPADDRMAKFVSTVLADTEDVWKAVFAKGGSEVPGAASRAVSRRHIHRLRHRPGGDGSVLLPGGPQGLHRPGLL